MLEPIKPPDEIERIDELHSLLLLDTLTEERFDRITRTTKRLFGVEIAVVSLVDTNRQWFKSIQGLDACETPRGISFCGHAILQEDAFIVEDAMADPRFADNPLVTGSPFIRFYAGMPLRGPNGYRVGTLCIIDPKPRKFTDADIATLKDLAALVEAEFSARDLSQIVIQARANAARLHAILDNIVDGIITFDDHGNIATINPAALKIFGYQAEEILGRNINVVVPELHHAAQDGNICDYLRICKTKVIGEDRDVFGQRKDGSIFLLELAVSEMKLNGKRAFSGILRDTTQRKEAEKALLFANTQLAATTELQKAILNSANFSMIATDLNGLITVFNAGAERMLGYKSEEMLGLHTPAILHDFEEVKARTMQLSAELGRAIEPGFECFIARVVDYGVDESEWTYVRKDGTRFPVMLSITPVLDKNKMTTSFLGIAYDLTERKKIDKLKNEFISTVSHELRTPLTSIRGSIGLLMGGAVGEIPTRADSLLKIAQTNCERLGRLINDILDIEKIESGHMQFDKKIHPIHPLVEQAIQATQSYATQYSVKFVFQPSDVQDFALVDTDRIMQVMANLLSNAAKFSPVGAEVRIKLAHVDTGVRISVIDQGSGILPEFQGSIFQKFAQEDSSNTRKKGGTGLGLNISKAIIEMHQGRIGFKTEQGVGTEFYFDLPLAIAPEQIT